MWVGHDNTKYDRSSSKNNKPVCKNLKIIIKSIFKKWNYGRLEKKLKKNKRKNGIMLTSNSSTRNEEKEGLVRTQEQAKLTVNSRIALARVRSYCLKVL